MPPKAVPADLTDDTLWEAADVSAFFKGKISVKTLRNWRAKGYGPRHVKVGTRVLYRPDTVREWARSRERGGEVA